MAAMTASVDDPEVKLKSRTLQDKILSSIEEDPSLYDPRDVSVIKKDLWYCSKFIKHVKGNEEVAYDRMVKSLQWRKSNGTNDLTFDSLDKDVLKSGIAFDRGVDKNGSKIVCLNIRMHKKDPGKSQALQRIMVFSIEQHFWRFKDQKVVMFFDMSDTGISNMDLEMVKFIIQLFGHHFPDTLAYLLVYKLPWILNAAWSIIKSWLNEAAVSKIKFVNESSISAYIDPSNLLLRYGGTDSWQFEYKPELYVKYLSVEDDEEVQDEEEWDGDQYLAANEQEMSKEDEDGMLEEPVPDHFDSMVDVSALPNHEADRDNDDSTARKQVHFDDSNPQGTSHRTGFSGDANTSIRRRQVEKILTLQGAGPQRSQSSGPVLVSGSVEDSLDGEPSMLGLNPSKELVFSRSSTGEKKCTLTVTNLHSASVTYKIKTTAPNRYRVKPNINSLEVDHSIKIQIQLTDQEALKGPISADKFLIQAHPLTDNGKDLAGFWKVMPPSAAQEFVLFCRLDEAPAKPSSKRPISTQGAGKGSLGDSESSAVPHSSSPGSSSSSGSKSVPTAVQPAKGLGGKSPSSLMPAPHQVETRVLEQQVSKLLVVCQKLEYGAVRTQRIAMATLSCVTMLMIFFLIHVYGLYYRH